MKRLLTFCLLLLIFNAPALAQDATASVASTPSPAAYLPSDIPVYLELHTDSAGLDAINQLLALNFQLNGLSVSQTDGVGAMVASSLNNTFPGIDLRQDVLPWLGDTIALAQINPPGAAESAADSLLVLPIKDDGAAQAFIAKFLSGVAPQSVSGVSVYTVNDTDLALGTDVIWFGETRAINTFLQSPMFQRLTDNPRYQKVRAALPAAADLTAYVSGDNLSRALTETASPDMPAPITLIEAALRIHPAQSAAEDALLQQPAINGIGAALQVNGTQIDATAILSLDAQYPAPTLTNATAGTTLLNLIPDDSFVVFDSYDPSATALPLAALAYLGPTVNRVFDQIVAGLGPTDATPTPTPSPTPVPPQTADTIIAQAQPLLAQAQSTMGLSLDELYGLIDGEYAVALFPGVGPTLGEALYLQSSDPQKLIDTLDHVSHLILTDPANDTQLIALQHSTVDGMDVVTVSGLGLSDPLTLGILPDNVLFVTTASTAAKVIEAAKTQSTTPALHWRDQFGSAQAALLYLDPRTVDLYNLRTVRNPPLPISTLAGSFAVQDNGLFVLHLTAATGS